MTLAPDTSPQLVEGKLRRAWRKGRRFHHAQGLAHFLMWLVAMVPVDLLIDRLFLVPGSGRLALLAFMLKEHFPEKGEYGPQLEKDWLGF